MWENNCLKHLYLNVRDRVKQLRLNHVFEIKKMIMKTVMSDRMTTRASEITECKMWNNFQRKVKTGTHKRRQVIGNCEFTK